MPQASLDSAREAMVAHQIRTCDVLDECLLERLRTVPREDFVPVGRRAAAFADAPIPIGRGQVMFAPMLDARLINALALAPRDRVLEIGTGTGYVTAVMAGLAGFIHSVEIMPEFKLRASTSLAAHGIANVLLETGDGARGWPRHAPYDAILVSGALPLGPDPQFRESLAVGGRLVVIVGESPAMEARLIVRERADHFTERSLFETDVPVLMNAPRRERFSF
ncbi:protein-L-isoaspartate O-methyltransferase [Acidiferrobacter sp.]|uniref:protein-L-isoaspartate O-methyltransferase family protein n=1 Tax=Acidiferrobacter sp. TaxID=1872107 RepID=UPI002610E34D|nr:protein-L-isoaspartate O-methyltransferase [Acidiferrobacter sp.]